MKTLKAGKLFLSLLVFASVFAIVGCGEPTVKEQSEVEKIIAQAEKMSFTEIVAKAMEESNGKTFTAVGNSSRGKTALENMVKYFKTIDAAYEMKYDWQQPKNNSIFEMLTTDSKNTEGLFSMTLIQDGNQIESKMVQTGILDTYIPKEWAEANNTTADAYKGYLSLQTLNKVFMFNNVSGKTYTNFWDYVAEGEHGLYMDIDSEVVGKNFLFMLTQDKYAALVKSSFEALDAAKQAYFQPTIDAMAAKATELRLGADGKYALAWIKLWVESYSAQSDDGPICNMLVQKSAVDQFGLLVYSKLRSVTESTDASCNNVTVAAYQDGYNGIGGYGYCHYLFVTDNSPLPWTACALIAYMTIVNEAGETNADKIAGFSAWGKDMGGYSSNPTLAELNEVVYHHKTNGMDADGVTVLFPNKNDKGFDWWKNEGKLVIEEPTYCAKVAFTVGAWMESLTKYKG